VYNLLMLYPEDRVLLLGFSSCHRFSGEVRFNTRRLEIVVDCEGLQLAPGETRTLEEVFVSSGEDREDLLETFGRRIATNHPRPAC
ncbi:MAG: alpha-galactosidase, partial [Akkermansiaceae bacterium]|nr:alpha-galactosidase [Akkermansiaceae bacterium]